MKPTSLKYLVLIITGLTWLAVTQPTRLGAQMWPDGPPTPQNQRQLLNQLKTQLDWMENATRTAHMFNTAPDAVLWEHFNGLCVGFQVLKSSLTPAQLQRGANDLAELDAGLAIIGEAFPNFEEDLNRGRPGPVALRTLCQVLRDATKIWGDEFNRVARRLQIGR